MLGACGGARTARVAASAARARRAAARATTTHVLPKQRHVLGVLKVAQPRHQRVVAPDQALEREREERSGGGGVGADRRCGEGGANPAPITHLLLVLHAQLPVRPRAVQWPLRPDLFEQACGGGMQVRGARAAVERGAHARAPPRGGAATARVPHPARAPAWAPPAPRAQGSRAASPCRCRRRRCRRPARPWRARRREVAGRATRERARRCARRAAYGRKRGARAGRNRRLEVKGEMERAACAAIRAWV